MLGGKEVGKWQSWALKVGLRELGKVYTRTHTPTVGAVLPLDRLPGGVGRRSELTVAGGMQAGVL